MKVLIPTQVNDTHAIAVAMALQQKGHHAIRWFVADFPNKQRASIELANEVSTRISVSGSEFEEEFNDIDVVWFRRPTLPTAPTHIHEDDIAHTVFENSVFFHSLWSLLSNEIVWVNPFTARRLARSKLYQLRAAQIAGFSIPRTLASNNPETIRKFLAEDGNEKIFKPFRVAEWQIENRTTALLQTSRISSDCEFSDISFQSAAGIYQERVEKEYELRINYFGGKIIAVKLDSQKNVNSKLDWRVIPPEELTPVIVDLPSNITAKCHTLMANLGLVFGCIDIIVTLNGEYCFLEVNEMGQFLWIERANPEIRILDAFCDFLLTVSRTEKNATLLIDKRVRYGDLIEDLNLHKR